MQYFFNTLFTRSCYFHVFSHIFAQDMTTRSIAYDISNEMARRIVDEARALEREEALKNRLHMVIYILVDNNCWLGIFHVWKDADKIFMTCIDDCSDIGIADWLHPIELTPKNMTRLFTRRHDDEDCNMAMLLYFGDQMPEVWHEPDEYNQAACLSGYFKNVAFCQEYDVKPTPDELRNMVLDFF